MAKMMNNAFIGRVDGEVSSGNDFSNPIQDTYIHKQVVVRVGETEDDFLLDEKPFKVDSVNIQKQIDEAAKGTDLKSLILQVLRTGDESLLNQSQGTYADITGYPDDPIKAHNAIIAGKGAYDGLPDDLKAKGVEGLAGMTLEDINNYIDKKIAEKTGKKESKKEPEKVDIKATEGDK